MLDFIIICFGLVIGWNLLTMSKNLLIRINFFLVGNGFIEREIDPYPLMVACNFIIVIAIFVIPVILIFAFVQGMA
jgi:hypothetical protein